MTADVLEASVFYNDEDKSLSNVPYATSIFYLSQGKVVGRYYIKSVKRTGVSKYLIQATSLIGLFERETFYGGIYSNVAFSDVLNEILYCDGISPKYNVFIAKTKPDSSRNVYGVNTNGIQPSTDQWKYHLHTEFVLDSPNWSGSSTNYSRPILGYYVSSISGYHVHVEPERYNGAADSWTISVRYGNYSVYLYNDDQNNRVIGNGSRVVIDVNPMAGKIHCVVYYKKPGNPSETGVLVKDLECSLAERSDACQLGYIFGPSRNGSAYSYPCNITWKSYDVYDENDNYIISGLFVQDPNDSSRYNIANAIDGTMSYTTYFEPNGGSIGALSDLSRYKLMLNISDTIEFNEGVDELPVFGWIPVTSRREALHQLLFSQNINLLKSSSGGFIFTPLASAVAGTIADDDIYIGGSEEMLGQARSVNVTEHSFSSINLSSQVIFDNSQSDLVSGDYIASFQNAPIYGTPVAGSGITIKAYNCNAAIVSGRGIITGTPYIHSKALIKSSNPATLEGADVSVSDVSLITPANSDNVVKKLEAYYFKSLSKITNGIKYNGEKCGIVYSFKSPFQEQISAYLTKVSAKSSSFVKGDCEFIKGYKSPESGGGYNNYVILANGDTFTIPAEVLAEDVPTIRLNLIGRGSAGTAGEDGEDGSEINESAGSAQTGGAGGKGGKGGEGGEGGKIYSVTVNVANIRSVSASQSGEIMYANTYNASSSLVSTYTSTSGQRSASGFTNIFTGIPYAVPGNKGVDGGAGGQGGGIFYGEPTWQTSNCESGENAGNYRGGTTNTWVISDAIDYPDNVYLLAAYGGGGGASGGANGHDAYQQGTLHINGGSGVHTFGGNGADGGNPVVTNATYGCGGSGGNGGGGGGGGGVRFESYSQDNQRSYPEAAGTGGAGGQPSNGIDGCVIIYY